MALNLRPFVFPAVLLGALEWWARTTGRGSDALAPPSAAVRAFVGAAGDGTLLTATAFTLGSAALGLLIGLLLGVAGGTLLGLSRRAATLASLSVEVARPVPSVALIPLSLLVFGFGLRMQVAVVAFATFWPMLVLSQAAARQIEPRLLEVSLALGLSPQDRVRKIVIPAMVPARPGTSTPGTRWPASPVSPTPCWKCWSISCAAWETRGSPAKASNETSRSRAIQ